MISLPSMARGLETDILGISWALISFQLASISLSVVFGRVGDIYGRRTVYLMGFLILAVSSFLCGMSQNIAQLIIFRFFQGVGGAMTQSVSRTLAMEAMPEGSEGKAQGLMTTAFHSGFFVGPPIGGFLIEYFNWRGIFFFIVPFALAGLALSSIRPKGSSVRGPSRGQGSLDYKGALLLIGLTVMLILLLDRKTAEFITAMQKTFLALVFAGTVWFFAVYERRVASPIVNFSLFKIRMFSCSVFSLLTLSVTRGFMSFLMPFYLQEILSISPLFMGFIYLVPPIFTITLAPLTGHMTDKIGPRTPATLGVAVSIVVLLLGVILRA
ncbi:MAG: MFS transporter, partial [Candidatus Binatia bacterium]|nr:MFS transporter [Candidatus Binatia bacterium]